MSIVGNSNDSLTLYQAAEGYLSLGFSVIPVQTDPGHAKVAAVGWKPYQRRLATDTELHTWFVEQQHSGIAIVTGTISKLMVLDFDDRHIYERFCYAYPDLRQTYTVRTRRGHHLYYHIPDNCLLRSRKGEGIDLQANGSYVVAPPTAMEGYRYRISLAVPPRTLSPNEIALIGSFFDCVNPGIPISVEKSELGAFSQEIGGVEKRVPQSQEPNLTIIDLQFLYSSLACKGSRNEALFRVSLKARDDGWDQQRVITALTNVHAREPAAGDHGRESLRQRQREAEKTIQSAFSRPAHRFTRATVSNPQLPNSVREKLFQLHQTYTIRVLDGLRLAGLQPGQAFTTKQALGYLRGRIGRDSIYHALKATTTEGFPIFVCKNPPLDTPNSTANADNGMSTGQPKNAFLVGQKNQEKRVGGRPERIFIMPSNVDLCRKLKVKLTWSDPFTEEDLTSAKKTRMAAHCELIKRRSGLYPRRWLARRLGVSMVTLDRYNREAPILVRSYFSEKPISWEQLNDLPLSLEIEGTFLEDETGKRYPARREIARKLLARKHSLRYRRQEVNYYSWDEQPRSKSRPMLARVPQQLPQWLAQNDLPQMVTRALPASAARPLMARSQITDHTVTPSVVSRKDYRDQAANDEMAERVYRTIARLSLDKAQRMSKANAHRLVETYGTAAVEQALKKLKWYAGKGKVTKPAGFLITTARLAWRELHSSAV